MSAAVNFGESMNSAVEFATADQYGGPLQAAVAMQLQSLNPGSHLPDSHFVNALARRDRTGGNEDLDSSLGVAYSHCDTGKEIWFIGAANPTTKTDEWLQVLQDRHNAHIDDRAPTAKALFGLLQGGWSVLLHADGEAFGRPDTPVHPVLVLGANSRWLTVHNPGNHDMTPRPFQKIRISAALGRSSLEASSRVSLLAVRRSAATADGVKLTRH